MTSDRGNNRAPSDRLIDELLDGGVSAERSQELLRAIRHDAKACEDLARARIGIELLREPVDAPDLSGQILGAVHARRRFLPGRSRRLVTGGRLAVAAGVVGAVPPRRGAESSRPRSSRSPGRGSRARRWRRSRRRWPRRVTRWGSRRGSGPRPGCTLTSLFREWAGGWTGRWRPGMPRRPGRWARGLWWAPRCRSSPRTRKRGARSSAGSGRCWWCCASRRRSMRVRCWKSRRVHRPMTGDGVLVREVPACSGV